MTIPMRTFYSIAAILQLLLAPQNFAQKVRPNILIILTDGVRRSEFGCYGSTNALTPQIDALAVRGVRFTDAYSAAPVGFATRAALMTGQHPARLQLTDVPESDLQEQSFRHSPSPAQPMNLARVVTLPKILSAAGYECADFTELDLSVGNKSRATPRAQAARATRFIEHSRHRPWFVAVSLEATSITEIDAAVGDLRTTLGKLEITPRTLVILTATHGAPYPANLLQTAATAYQPLNGQEGYLHEGGIRVPLIITWANHVQKGSLSREVSVTMDLFPTILEATEANADLNARNDGLSLLAVLQSGGKLPREFLCWHYPHYGRFGAEPASAIRMGNFKLIQFHEFPRAELFNLSTDLGERRNLADSHPSELNQLRSRLELWKQVQPVSPLKTNLNFSSISKPNSKGIIVLPGRLAEPHGTLIRYEPQPHKTTVGYWANGQDWVSWQFDLPNAGSYEVEIQQGCGTGGDGSDMRLNVGEQSLSFVVQQTGHFQNFVTRKLGSLKLKKGGPQSLELRALTKRGGAVMDIRQIRLIPVTNKNSSH